METEDGRTLTVDDVVDWLVGATREELDEAWQELGAMAQDYSINATGRKAARALRTVVWRMHR